MFDVNNFLHSDALGAAIEWNGYPRFNFIGGHNDSENIPVVSLRESIDNVILKEGKTLAKYGLESGPQGYIPLRSFISSQLKNSASINCSEKEILVVSGSLQALDLVNTTFLKRGDTVIIEEENYGGTISRLKRLGVNMVGIPLEKDGMDLVFLQKVLDRLEGENKKPRYIYTIPTIQNPTGTIMSVEKRKGLIDLSKKYMIPIFEDDCYADLIYEKKRPPAIKSFDDEGYVIYCGSFSKSIAPALRVGYLVADWNVLSRILPYKTDAGSGSLEQMALAEFCKNNFSSHVNKLRSELKKKSDAICDALDKYFGSTADYQKPDGGIFIWIEMPEEVDTSRLYEIAIKQGVAINPGQEWSINPNGKRKMRLCYGNPTIDEIDEGIKLLAEICQKEFGIPNQIANL
ncbi:MAG: PLP-dependent aminotransferase family protein [Candidatus Puniceispirillales bacterium]|jgi:2-aminoadipate transaminase|nr:PLP-dependent aminotransferase family protein [Alphaproteobacteria bacterium]MBL6850698.1 PLP-dependent aminotransferase family protein [Alphaproteobacteria bacterium]MDA0916213.1 PLP-dependent aminotransferase family protein [Pseudomonadota bacterium]